MAVGKSPIQDDVSPIVKAIGWAESKSTAEIRVHISRRWFEPDPYGRARDLFDHFGMFRTPRKNAILFYFNVRLQRFAIVADLGVDAKLGSAYWPELAGNLKEDLQSTHFENAVAIAVRTLGISLQKIYPTQS